MNNQDQELLTVFLHGFSFIFHAVFTTAIELNLFEIIAKASEDDAQLSAAVIASHLSTKNEQAPVILDRMMQLLASHSLLRCTTVSDGEGNPTRLYGLTSMSKFLVTDETGVSLAPEILWYSEKVMRDSCYNLKDAIFEGGIPFHRVNGMDLAEYERNSSRFNQLSNATLRNNSIILMRELLQVYKGFEELKEIVDVGGGQGSTLNEIISKYPQIKGINFDLPDVIKDAPSYPGVEHVEGDMLQYVPRGEVILIKMVFSGFADDLILKALTNCWEALPEYGKVILIDIILPESPETNALSKFGIFADILALSVFPGGRMKTRKDFENLAKQAGFKSSKFVCSIQHYGILEFYKN